MAPPPIYTQVQILQRCDQILTEIEQFIGETLSDELSDYVTITWTDAMKGINQGDPIPTAAQLPRPDPKIEGGRRVRLALVSYLSTLQEAVGQAAAMNGASTVGAQLSTEGALLKEKAQGVAEPTKIQPGKAAVPAPSTEAKTEPSLVNLSSSSKNGELPPVVAVPASTSVPGKRKSSMRLPAKKKPRASTSASGSASLFEPSLQESSKNDELPVVSPSWAAKVPELLDVCPILGFQSKEVLFAFLAEPIVFEAFREYLPRKRKGGHGTGPDGKGVRDGAVEELLQPSKRLYRLPADKSRWIQKDSKVSYILNVIGYGRAPGGIWENVSNSDIPTLVHAVLALNSFMTHHSYRPSTIYRNIEVLYKENNPDYDGMDLNDEARNGGENVGRDEDEDDDPSFLFRRSQQSVKEPSEDRFEGPSNVENVENWLAGDLNFAEKEVPAGFPESNEVDFFGRR